jgi:hypothetical protein
MSSPNVACLVLVVTFGLSVAMAPSPAQSGSPLLQKARAAVSPKVTTTSLVLEGTVLWEQTWDAAPLEARTGVGIELLFLGPDQFRRGRSSPTMISYEGFNGTAPIQGVKVTQPGTSANVSGADEPWAAVRRARAARFLLGQLGVEDAVLPLKAVSRPGSSTLQITGPNRFECELDLDKVSGMPIAVRHLDTAYFFPPMQPGQHERRGVKEDAEYTTAFTDRRPVNGVSIAHRVTVTIRGLRSGQRVKVEELEFTKVFINPKLTAADFQVPR